MPKPPYHTAKPGLWEKLRPTARAMRREPTEAENALWQRLRRDALGVGFRRQHAIDRFIVDFVCLSAKLIVEVDGGIHADPNQQGRDLERERHLEERGFRVMRFTNRQVMEEMDGVLGAIQSSLEEFERPAK
jgi:very-short-patch-repair endonuclease